MLTGKSADDALHLYDHVVSNCSYRKTLFSNYYAVFLLKLFGNVNGVIVIYFILLPKQVLNRAPSMTVSSQWDSIQFNPLLYDRITMNIVTLNY